MWAFAITIYSLQFGDLPFHGESVLDIYEKIIVKNVLMKNYVLPDDLVMNEKIYQILKGIINTEDKNRLTVFDCISIMENQQSKYSRQ